MASRRRNAKAAAPAKGKNKGAKAAKPKKAAKQPKQAKEVKPGPPVEIVAVILTGVMLIAAIVMVDYVKGTKYGTGMFFAGSYEANS